MTATSITSAIGKDRRDRANTTIIRIAIAIGIFRAAGEGAGAATISSLPFPLHFFGDFEAFAVHTPEQVIGFGVAFATVRRGVEL